MLFSRPGKFRWQYDQPYPQLIVGDGIKLWVYDKELNQVTVKKLDQAVGSSPAALLAGENEIETAFTLVDKGRQGNLDWVEAIPKAADSSFEKMLIGFGAKGLEQLNMHDHFGHITQIIFSRVEQNPKIAADSFVFTPPAGADVIGE